MLLWIWLVAWAVFVLPLAIASLRGWAHRRVRDRTTPWGIRVRGVITSHLLHDLLGAAGTLSPK
ncbi:hypothetical protein ABT063_01805 [Streptomyces sp. NPDC002838]|uniref:hypothetical protein n=1 Tax=Streptomyces sp. NPDC002838 TaxID=3154436 RepID=UPI00332C8CAF